MGNWMFEWLLRGKSIEEIIEASTGPELTPDQVHAAIEREREKFEETCLRQVVSRARKGDVSAIDWLSKRGLFKGVRFEE